MGMLFGWLKEQGVKYSTKKINGGKLAFCPSFHILLFLYPLNIIFACSNFVDGKFVAYKRKMYQEMRSVRTKFGTKSKKQSLHSSTDEVIASTTLSQSYANVLHMLQEIHYTLQSRIHLRGGKEVTLLNYDQVVLSIQATGKFKVKRKLNIVGLVKKTTHITFFNTNTRDIEDFFYCVEDDSYLKCLFKLFCFLMNMCLSEQELFFVGKQHQLLMQLNLLQLKLILLEYPTSRLFPRNIMARTFWVSGYKSFVNVQACPPQSKEKLVTMGTVVMVLTCKLR
jgi:hypothetical protein